MQALDTQVNPRSADFRANADAMRRNREGRNLLPIQGVSVRAWQ